MKCYIEITLLPSADITPYFLWEKVYQQLHLALVEIQGSDKKVSVGVAFPEYDCEKYQLGSKLRMFAPSKEVLEGVKINKWLSRLSDYVHITSIREVPDHIEGYVYFKRLQLKSNNARLARRRAKHKGISIEQAMNFFEGRKEKYSRAPFIRIKSLSGDKRYHLMISRIDAQSSQAEGRFSTYGLSSSSSVPVF